MTENDLKKIVADGIINGFKTVLPEVLKATVAAKAKATETKSFREIPVPEVLKSDFAATGSGSDGRRLPEETQRLATTFEAIVKANPGKRIEELSVLVGTDTTKIKSIAKKAVELKLVRKEGQKRGTRYFPFRRGETRVRVGDAIREHARRRNATGGASRASGKRAAR